MYSFDQDQKASEKVIIKKCHLCGQIIESRKEVSKCPCCAKNFLPLNYFGKVHAKNTKEFDHLFAESDELNDLDIIHGLYVLW
jgi:hypothetical protein